MPDGGWRGLSRTKKQERSLAIGDRAIEEELGKCHNPGEPKAQAARDNTYIFLANCQESCRRAQVHFWPIAIEVDGHCLAPFLRLVTSVCNAAKELKEQHPQAFKQNLWKRIVVDGHPRAAYEHENHVHVYA
jgi:hypothetical protein